MRHVGRTAANRTLSLAERLQRSFRVMGAAIGLTLVVTAVMAVLLLGRYHPEVEQATDATRTLRLSHEAMLDNESGLRGYLLTGDERFLAEAERAASALRGHSVRLTRLSAGDPTLVALVLDMRVAQQRWIDEWASDAPGQEREREDEVASFIQRGKVLFDGYRNAHELVTNDMLRRRDDALAAERSVLLGGMAIELLIGSSLLALAYRQHRRLRAATVAPVGALLDAIERVRDGDLDAAIEVGGPDEVARLAAGLNDMVGSLAEQNRLTATREAEVVRQAERLSLLLGLAREVAGSLSMRYVCESVVEAGLRIGGFGRVAVWLVEADRSVLTPLYDSTGARGDTAGVVAADISQGVIGEAAQLARTAHDGARVLPGAPAGPLLVTEVAIPMVVGARVVGVLQFSDDHAVDLATSDLEILETLAIHAAAAIEAARLHRDAEEQAQVDALTRLHNRRRLDDDLALECERSVRYQRPLALVMVDVDHFKRFNDRHGHQAGDEALQQVSAVLRDGVRASDSAYRYGGEEFVLLLRETSTEGAAELAERLRWAIRERTRHLAEPVTASFGVAEVPLDAASAEGLIAAADRALYEAKRTGRNRVVCCSETSSLVV